MENNWQQNNNGIFFADIDTFRRNFSETQINLDTTDWKFASWLMTNDTSDATKSVSDCNNCTPHVVEVTNDSSEAQDIYVGAHIWQDRTYSYENTNCSGATEYGGQQFQIKCLASGDIMKFDTGYGSAWLNSMTFQAGETK